MTSILLSIFSIFAGIFLMSSESLGQAQAYKSSKIQLFQVNYSGEKNKSFADGGIGFGLEIQSDFGRSWGRVYGKTRGTLASGRQSFLDGASQVNCNYTFYQGQFELGLVLMPIPGREKGMNVFVSGAGTLGYNWLSLTSSTTLSQLKPSDSASSLGYVTGVGVEWTLGKALGKKHMLTGEINYRSDRTNLAGQSEFNLTGLSIHFGYGW